MRELPHYLQHPDVEEIYGGNYVVLDFETTNKEKGSALNPDNHLVLTCWYERATRTHKHNWNSEYEQQELLEAIEAADFLVCHNAKFELHWLRRCGYDIGSKPIFDTMVAEWVLAGNRHWGLFPALDDCLARRSLPQKFSLVSQMISAGVCPSDIPRPWLLRYCHIDVDSTHMLMEEQINEMEGNRLLPVVFTRCITIPALTDLETKGMHLDPKLVRKEYKAYNEEYVEVMAKLDKLTGGINPKSNIQVAQYVYGTLGFKEKKDRRGKFIRGKPGVFKAFPDGLPKTDEATLLSLNPDTDEQLEFLALKKRQAQLSSALDKNLSMFLGAVEERAGAIFATFDQCTTGTHRLSSSGRPTLYEMFDKPKGCQFQNLPNIFKGLFTARNEGWLIAEADYSQLEYRGAGFVTQDPLIYQEVSEGYDVHRYTASVLNGIEEADVTGGLRRAAKADTFKPLYGGSSGTEEQQKYYTAFKQKYKVMNDTQESWCIIVENDKELETPWGMKYYWPKAKVNHGYLNCKTQVYNYPIQGFATAEVVPIGLTMFWHRIRDYAMFLICTVHDSVEVELPEEEMELFVEAVVQALTRDVYKYLREVYEIEFDMPLGVGMVIGTHWSKPSVSEERWDQVNQTLELPEYHYDDGEVSISVLNEEAVYEN
jgi:DNA polymerase I-like protein with 3'-5' exonuclease and polymerase domains